VIGLKVNLEVKVLVKCKTSLGGRAPLNGTTKNVIFRFHSQCREGASSYLTHFWPPAMPNAPFPHPPHPLAMFDNDNWLSDGD